LGDQYHTISLKESFEYLNDKKEEAEEFKSKSFDIGPLIKSDKPSGRIALTNTRIITMDNKRSVIENGTIIIHGNKIETIGTNEKVNIPASTKSINLKGKKIMPVLIDGHDQQGTYINEIKPEKHLP